MNIADNIKISVLQTDPCLDKLSKYEIGTYLSKYKFKETFFTLDQLPEVITTGKILNCLYMDEEYIRKGYKGVYVGSQIVFVDVDEIPLELEPKTFISKLKYEPTAYTTSYTNRQKTPEHPNGDKEWRLHLYYIFDEVIYGKENYLTIYDNITADFPKKPDSNARSPLRIYFTTYKYKPDNKEYYRDGYSNKIYNASDFLSKNDTSCIIKKSTNNVVVKNNKDFELDPYFLHDFNKMSRYDFVKKYETIYPRYTHTFIDPNVYKSQNGYRDLRGVTYYIIPSAKRVWDHKENRSVTVKVVNGKRDTTLWVDAAGLKKIIPNVTKEHLVFNLTAELLYNFCNNFDFNNRDIIRKASVVWNTPEEDDDFDYSSIQVDKTLQVDMQYWNEQGVFDKHVAVGKSRKNMTNDDIAKYYDTSLTIEKNLDTLHKNGLKTKKKRLIEWCEDYNVDYITEKELRNNIIKEIMNEDSTRSYRDIARIYEEKTGNKIDHKTVISILSE